MKLRPARRPRLGIATVLFASFWVAGQRPSMAALLALWCVYWALSERPQVGVQWALFAAGLFVMDVVLAIEARVT